MNRVFQQSSLVQQMMMGGSPNWWNVNNMRPPSDQQASPLLPPSSSSSSSTSSPSLALFHHFPQPSSSPLPMTPWQDTNQDQLPESWSQLLLGGLVGEEERCSFTPFQAKKMENWDQDHHVVYPSSTASQMLGVKNESCEGGGYGYRQHGHNEEIQAAARQSSWTQILPSSSPSSCVTTSFSSNMLDFSNKPDKRQPHTDNSSECNSRATGAAFKKARVQASSTPATFKVRKEKLGDRITALHQLVSPFGKTDTASVLQEATGYIRFLQSQIEALSSPYLGTGSGNTRQPPAQGERNCIFPEDPGQLLNDNCMKRKGLTDQNPSEELKKDLRSRGLCLVPVSCTLHVGSDNGADYWAPAAFGGGFR